MVVTLGRRQDVDALDRMTSESFAPRLAKSMNLLVVVAVLTVQLLNVSNLVVDSSGGVITGGQRALCYLAVALLFGLQLIHSSRRLRPRRLWLLLVTLAVQAAISYIPTIYLGEAWGGAAGFLLGSVLLLLKPAWLAFSVFGVFEVLTGYIAYLNDETVSNIAYAVVANGLTALVIYSVSRLSDIVTDLHAARGELAAHAVEEERQRFSRDLHDLLGYSLSAIALKGELAYLKADTDLDEAKQEITSMLSIARVALQDVRSVARSYRAMPLEAQVRSAQSVLRSAGVQARIEYAEGVGIAGQCETVLATVVREGVTNLMRHSKAEECAITLVAGDETVTLTVRNDGVDVERLCPQRRPDGSVDFGDAHVGGLQNLQTRVHEVQGTLRTALDDDGWFVLEATVPTRIRSRSAG